MSRLEKLKQQAQRVLEKRVESDDAVPTPSKKRKQAEQEEEEEPSSSSEEDDDIDLNNWRTLVIRPSRTTTKRRRSRK